MAQRKYQLPFKADVPELIDPAANPMWYVQRVIAPNGIEPAIVPPQYCFYGIPPQGLPPTVLPADLVQMPDAYGGIVADDFAALLASHQGTV